MSTVFSRDSHPAIGLYDPDGLSQSAGGAEPSLAWSFGRLYRERMRPTLGRLRPGSLRKRDDAVARWEKITGDPPIAQVDNALCQQYVDTLLEMPGRSADAPEALFERLEWAPGDWQWMRAECDPEADPEELRARWPDRYRLLPTLSARTAAGHCREMATVIRFAGAPDKAHPMACDLYAEARDARGRPIRAPWFTELPAGESAARERAFEHAHIERWLAATAAATTPAAPDLPAPVWWDALIRVLYFTGLRIGSALALESAWVSSDSRGTWLDIPAAAMKGRRRHLCLLHPRAVEAIERVRRPERALLFPHDCCLRTLHRERTRQQLAAGIPTWGFHAIRKLVGDLLYLADPAAAQAHLGHRNRQTTEGYYVQRATIARTMARPLKTLPDLLAVQPDIRHRSADGQALLF